MQTISAFLVCWIAMLSNYLTFSLQNVVLVDEKGLSKNNYLSISPGRTRREPAVWGEPAPDYSSVVLDGITRYLRALLFVDKRIVSHYNNDMSTIKSEVVRTVKEANEYFYQADIRITVIDVMQIYGSDLSLYSFESYRYKRLKELPPHDFAVLLSYRYGGGLAFVDGMCTTKAVMLCGFYPHNPEAMGSIFFHEVAHLLGVPHRNTTNLLKIKNCACNMSLPMKPFIGCLRIPGFDHDCTIQEMANFLQRKTCLKVQPTNDANAHPMVSKTPLFICGNGILEDGEDCDCGLPKYCKNWNCRPKNCTTIIKSWHLYLCSGVTLLAAAVLALMCIRTKHHRQEWKKYSSSSKNFALLIQPFEEVCNKPCFWRTKHKFRGTMNRFREREPLTIKSHKIDKSSIVVVGPHLSRTSTFRQTADNLTRSHSLSRPSVPPPPPPTVQCSKSISSNGMNIKNIKIASLLEPLLQETAKSDHLSSSRPIELSDNLFQLQTGKINIDRHSVHNEEDYVTHDDFDEIGKKFEDFDEEFGSREKIYFFQQPYPSDAEGGQILDQLQTSKGFQQLQEDPTFPRLVLAAVPSVLVESPALLNENNTSFWSDFFQKLMSDCGSSSTDNSTLQNCISQNVHPVNQEVLPQPSSQNAQNFQRQKNHCINLLPESIRRSSDTEVRIFKSSECKGAKNVLDIKLNYL